MWNSQQEIYNEYRRRFDALEEEYSRDKKLLFDSLIQDLCNYSENKEEYPPVEFIETSTCFELSKNIVNKDFHSFFITTILAGYWPEEICHDNYSENFYWRFQFGSAYHPTQRIRCIRPIIDLVFLFWLLQIHSIISKKYPLEYILPQHFVQKNGEPIDPRTIIRERNKIQAGHFKLDLLQKQYLTSKFPIPSSPFSSTSEDKTADK